MRAGKNDLRLNLQIPIVALVWHPRRVRCMSVSLLQNCNRNTYVTGAQVGTPEPEYVI